MAYVFNKETAATFKIPAAGTTDGTAINFKGVNANVASADTIVAGIQGLFYIANKQQSYNYTSGIRVVNEDVDYDE